MFSHFANIAGFWVLAGIPIVLVIHLLQQKSRRLKVSTLFLMDALPPESSTGRVLDRIRSSRSLWLQLLAVLLCTWILAEPRFVREDSSQTVAVVLDDSAGMLPFADEARSAALTIINDYEGRAAFTHWVIMCTSSRKEALYRGPEPALARDAVHRWIPSSGTHDPENALRIAAGLTERNGFSWFITDKEEKCPLNQAAIGVGRPIANTGFAGVVRVRQGNVPGWRVAVKNSSSGRMEKRWFLKTDGMEQDQGTITIEAGGISEFFVAHPAGAGELLLSLESDEFTLDDYLPLVQPEPKKLLVSLNVESKTDEFFRKLLDIMEGVRIVPEAEAALRIFSFSPSGTSPLTSVITSAGVSYLAVGGLEKERSSLSLHPLVPERLPLLEGLSWNGLLSTGPLLEGEQPGSVPLLWQGGGLMAWKENNSLVINWDWPSSNASRLPSFVLFIRRFIEEVQSRQPGYYADNVILSALLNTHDADLMKWRPAGEAADRTAALHPPYRAPDEVAFFHVYKDGQELMHGATRFDDARQGDFSASSRFVHPLPPSIQERRERLSLPDPWVPLWLLMIMLALIGAWWPAKKQFS